MTHFRTLAAAFAAAGIFAAAAQAADRKLTLDMPKPLRDGVNAMPRIAAPADDAERRIDTALARLDATMRRTKADCGDEQGKPGDWARTVDAPMQGPGYLSFVITDAIECPDRPVSAGTMSIVYDLKSGAPVDWTRLLPASLTGKVALQPGADGTKMVTLAAPRLYALYVAGYRTDDTPADDDQACHDAVAAAGADAPPPAMVWLDAKAGGLAVQFELDPPDNAACSDPVVIPTATLRQEGANAALVDALEAAHRE